MRRGTAGESAKMTQDPQHPAVRHDLGAPPQDLLRAVFDSVIGFIGIMTPDGVLIEVNGPAMQISGLARDAVIGKALWDCDWWNYDPAVQNRLRAAVNRAASGEPIRYEADVRIAGDKRITIDFLLTPHLDESGKVDFLIPSGIDVTERVRNERLLRAANDSWHDLVTRSPFGIYAVDADFRMAMVSVGAQKVFQNVTPLIGRDFAEILRLIWPEPFASEAIYRFRHTLATGETYHAPSTVEQRRDIAEVESYDWKIERMVLPDGRRGAVCHFYDLSEREEHSKALQAGEVRFRATVDNAAVGIAHMTPDGRWTLVNKKLCDILGYSEAELLGMTFKDVTFNADLEKDIEHQRRVRSGEIAEYELEKRYVTKAGRIVWANLTVSSIRKADGTLDYWIKIVEDITQKKAAERHQRLLIAELNHRVKNILATVQAMASHTMRTAVSLTAFRDTFAGRLRAIAASHDSVFQKGEMQAELMDIIRKQLAPYAASGADRLSLSGPSLQLNAASAHALGLVIHELTTNATKYGGLSDGNGHIAVSWEAFLQDDRRFARLIWRESGGPPVKAPTKTGFGSRLITSTLQHSLRGTARLEYREEGLVAELTFELAEAENA